MPVFHISFLPNCHFWIYENSFSWTKMKKWNFWTEMKTKILFFFFNFPLSCTMIHSIQIAQKYHWFMDECISFRNHLESKWYLWEYTLQPHFQGIPIISPPLLYFSLIDLHLLLSVLLLQSLHVLGLNISKKMDHGGGRGPFFRTIFLQRLVDCNELFIMNKTLLLILLVIAISATSVFKYSSKISIPCHRVGCSLTVELAEYRVHLRSHNSNQKTLCSRKNSCTSGLSWKLGNLRCYPWKFIEWGIWGE